MKKIVFNIDQLKDLIDNPILASAVFQSFKTEPDITVKDAFMLGRASIKQLEMFQEALKNGEFVQPKSPADVDANVKVVEAIMNKAPRPVRGAMH